MSEESERVIRHLRKDLGGCNMAPAVFPVVALDRITWAESRLGFELPPTLKRIYLEIGNGGSALGPEDGILGLPGGWDNDEGLNIVDTSNEWSKANERQSQCILIPDRYRWSSATVGRWM